MKYECGRPGLPGVPDRVVPGASSTPQPYERQMFGGPLLTSVPDGLPPINCDDDAPASVRRRPLSPQDEASASASGARPGLTGRARSSVPAQDHSAGEEQGLTARPSPSRSTRLGLKDLSPSPVRRRPFRPSRAV